MLGMGFTVWLFNEADLGGRWLVNTAMPILTAASMYWTLQRPVGQIETSVALKELREMLLPADCEDGEAEEAVEVGLAIENESHIVVYCKDDGKTVIHHFDQDGIHADRMEDWDGQLAMGKCLRRVTQRDVSKIVNSVNSQFGAYSSGRRDCRHYAARFILELHESGKHQEHNDLEEALQASFPDLGNSTIRKLAQNLRGRSKGGKARETTADEATAKDEQKAVKAVRKATPSVTAPLSNSHSAA